ncbi:ribosomal protein S18 acetylase RimI-like enzyme [Deinococcus metalli]|uniref:GNAT family N-acetyltransferase n=1 Tax=Deinococcus metalli TaxID=1141878 RepID=A0A7W8KFP3_9DEIO|nr:GNAT family N-acetyltransferase [Deinococcus metalli]MBB5377291.1 ribosomal protein S18 acetylase RimI-like enzyme [Deinococcus metalli]GHF47581.1 GNAT family N-acetyltransferase [Deinococcus metalli]
MNSATIEPATPDTLPDLYALHPDATAAARLMETFRGRVERGEVTLSDTLILRTPRGVEGSVTFGAMPHPYVFPHLRADAPAAAVTAFLLEVRRRFQVMPERQLVLDSSRAAVGHGSVLAAGWVLDDTQVIYETDLTVARPAPDPHASEGGAELLAHAEIQSLLAALGRSALGHAEGHRRGWTLVALAAGADDAAPVALGAYGPAKPGYGGVDMIGVRPDRRGLGLGTRLHRHLLARLSDDHDRHGGVTAADNHAMRRIFEKSGSVHTGTQQYFRQP